MGNREIRSHGTLLPCRDLLGSALAILLLEADERKHVYFASPWISDFVLFENHFREFEALLPELADQKTIRFSEYLGILGKSRPVRIITTENETSRNFLCLPKIRGTKQIENRIAKEVYHEKGILTPNFYIDGSKNITYQGLFFSGDKIVYYANEGPENAQKILVAYMEYDRHWDNLK